MADVAEAGRSAPSKLGSAQASLDDVGHAAARAGCYQKGVITKMAYYLAQASGLLNFSFPWSINFVLSAAASEATVSASFDPAIRGVFTDATFKAYIPTTVALGTTSVSTASATFRQTTKTTVSSSTVGDSSDVGLPYHTCEILTLRTSYATKWGRGRLFFPPLAVNALAADGFSILAAAQEAMQGAFNAYFTAVGSTYQHVILHKKATAGGGRAAYTTDTVAFADIPSTFAVQRRRADKLVPSRLSVTV